MALMLPNTALADHGIPVPVPGIPVPVPCWFQYLIDLHRCEDDTQVHLPKPECKAKALQDLIDCYGLGAINLDSDWDLRTIQLEPGANELRLEVPGGEDGLLTIIVSD